MKADQILNQAASIIVERGKLRDNEDGERSMERAVNAYIDLRGPVLQSELDGWIFMCVLKLARATAGEPHLDDMSDLAGYAALAGECLSNTTAPPISDPYTRDKDGWIVRDKNGWIVAGSGVHRYDD